MSEKSGTADSAGADDSQVRKPFAFAALDELIGGPKRKLFLFAGAALLVLLGLVAMAVVALLPVQKSTPPAAPVSPAPARAEAVPAPPEKESGSKSGIEERFEAIKRGDFAHVQAGRKVAEPLTSAPPEAVRSVVSRSEAPPPNPQEVRNPGANPGTTGAVGKAPAAGNAPAAEKPSTPEKPMVAEKPTVPGSPATMEKAAPPAPDATSGGCDVGASDPKASAAAILSCILQFNAMDSRERSRKPPAKPAPAN